MTLTLQLNEYLTEFRIVFDDQHARGHYRQARLPSTTG
jgi:hypothetical protein